MSGWRSSAYGLPWQSSLPPKASGLRTTRVAINTPGARSSLCAQHLEDFEHKFSRKISRRESGTPHKLEEESNDSRLDFLVSFFHNVHPR